MTSYYPYEMSYAQQREMQQKARPQDPFFGLKGGMARPTSIATEIMDTEWEEEDDLEEIEMEIEMMSEIDEDGNSPRDSLNSAGRRSLTTLSSYEEAHTPRSSRAPAAYPFDLAEMPKAVQGPMGPHLFRSSQESSHLVDEMTEALTLSPITPKAHQPFETDIIFQLAPDPVPAIPRSARSSPYQFTTRPLDSEDLVDWEPEMVAQWMLNAGVDGSIAEKFIEHDINGAILITLKSEDLKELHIQSFGMRTKVWDRICELRDVKVESPRPDTPIEDEESREVRKERRRQEGEERDEDCGGPRRAASKRRANKQPCLEDVISPMESVSIVGIEQMMPKPHNCSKGENCSKWRRQQRMIDEFKKDHPFVDNGGGVIMMAGDPGNAVTARALNRHPSTEALRPFSDAMPSVVASSDVLGPGPGMGPIQYLQEATLRSMRMQDPQDNVRQFLNFQHQGPAADEVPPTPPFEIYPSAAQKPHDGLQALPRLAIPQQQQQQLRRLSQQRNSEPKAAAQPQPPQQQPQSFVPYRMSRAEALSPDLQPTAAPYRFGTPFSDMDVPVTSVPLGPVARDASQSVPPEMNYRAPVSIPVRSMSRASRRPPSFQPLMAVVDENGGAQTPVARNPPSPQQKSPPRPLRPQHQLVAPPRKQYPWSPPAAADAATFPRRGSDPSVATLSSTQETLVDDGVTYQGPVRKRKTKMLRHEWHDQYATLKGTRLALHKDAQTRERTLEYVDIDDYAIACSSLASTSKLNAAFKAMHISRGGSGLRDKNGDAVAAFEFQLVHQPARKEGFPAKLHKRESSLGQVGGGLVEGANGTGKTHHFAVKSRDERIDWMRELMLAKALKQKGEGFEVSVNGNIF